VKKILVLASGRGSNFQALIDACKKSDIQGKIVALVSNNPHAEALNKAQQHDIPFFIVGAKNKSEYDEQLLTQCKTLNPDLIVLAGYMKILSKKFIDTFHLKIINIHPSLLPAFAGLHAQKQALEYGSRISGCTVHFVDHGVDTGPIILQTAVPVFPHDTVPDLETRILEKEHATLVQGVILFCDDKLVVQERNVYIK